MLAHFAHVQIVVLHKKKEKTSRIFFFLINRKWGIWAGSGAIMSNAVDMAKYMNFHLSNTDKNGNEFMTTANFNALHQQHRKLSSTTVNTHFGNEEVPTTENGYGLGWKRGLYRSM